MDNKNNRKGKPDHFHNNNKIDRSPRYGNVNSKDNKGGQHMSF